MGEEEKGINLVNPVVWIVDDDPGVRHVLRRTLVRQGEGYGMVFSSENIFDISDPKEMEQYLAFVAARAYPPPEIVFMDDLFEGFGEVGFSQLVPILRSQEWEGTCVILGLTSRASPYEDDKVNEAALNGCTLFFHKDGLNDEKEGFLFDQIKKARQRRARNESQDNELGNDHDDRG